MPTPQTMTAQEHAEAARVLLEKAVVLPLASSQRLTLTAQAQVHATLATLGNCSPADCKAAAPAKAAPRKRKATAPAAEAPAAAEEAADA